MSASGTSRHLSMLRRIARSPVRPPPPATEACDLCAQPLDTEHRHLLDLQSRRLLCACRACAVLFDHGSAGTRHYRLAPDRCRLVVDFELPDALWDRCAIPVELAFIAYNSTASRMVACYPSPAGAMESLLELTTWDQIAAANPLLATVEPDVEAVLVNRAHGAREYWLAPIDVCYRLVGLIRAHWKGLSGGEAVWREIEEFFAALRRHAIPVARNGSTVDAGGEKRRASVVARAT